MTLRFKRCFNGGVALLSIVLVGCQSMSDANHANVSPSKDGLMAGGVDPSSVDLQNGKHQFMEGNYGLAEKYFRQSVSVNQNSAEGWLGLAATYDRLRRFDLADKAYMEVVRLHGRQARVLNNMGYSQYLRGDYKTARLLYNEALQLAPDDAVIHANIALLG